MAWLGAWAHEDQTLPSGQLGSVNLIFVGLSQRSSHLRSHSNHFIQSPLKSLLCFPGSGSFSYIYTFALLLVLLTEGNAWRGRSYLTIEGCYQLWTSKIKKWSTCSQVPCFRRVVYCVLVQLFLSLGPGSLTEVAGSALLAAVQDVLLQL